MASGTNLEHSAKPRRRLRPGWAATIFAVALLASGCSFGARYIFRTSPALTRTPASVDLAYRNVDFTSDDGLALHGWLLPADSELPLVLFFHGNGGNISHRLPHLADLRAMGFPVFVFDYRGYGKSAGRPRSEEDLYRDGRAALAWLERNGRNPAQILYYGRSLGAAVALRLALENPPAGVVLEAAFTTLHEIAARIDPLNYYLFGFWSLGKSFDNLARVERLAVPLLVIHGRDDQIVPVAMGRTVYARAPSPKAYLEIAGAGHADTREAGGELYRRAWLELAETAAERQRQRTDDTAPERAAARPR